MNDSSISFSFTVCLAFPATEIFQSHLSQIVFLFCSFLIPFDYRLQLSSYLSFSTFSESSGLGYT